MAEADEEFDVEAARAAAVEAVAADPDHRVSLTDEQNVAAELGDGEHGVNDPGDELGWSPLPDEDPA